jgi:prefoldin alpha subunit
VLIPLTNSLYVPGKISDRSNVIVDIGTGYYVKKVCHYIVLLLLESDNFQSIADATVHYKGKVEFVTKNLESLQEAIQKKQDNLNYLVSIVQGKAAEEREQASSTAKPT